jgi:transposase
VRTTTAFNRILEIPGAFVTGVEFSPAGVVVRLRLRRAKHRCPCGWRTWSSYDRSLRKWRHLDLGAVRCMLEVELCRIHCRACQRVRTEEVAFARPGARHTREFEDVVAWLAQRTDKTTVTRLLRVSWEAVSRIVRDVVGDAIDDSRLDGLARIGVDEVSYRRGHRYLTVVADHDREGAVVWAGEGKAKATLEAFYDELGETRLAALQAVSLDLGRAYAAATDERAPHVAQCADPFHVIKLANEAIDKTRRAAWRRQRQYNPGGRRYRGGRKGALAPAGTARYLKNTRFALLKDPADLKDQERVLLEELRQQRSVLYRCWQLKEGLRDIYRIGDPEATRRLLEVWLAAACRCRIPAFVTLSKTIRQNRERILAAIELGLSNSRLEGLNSKIRLINHRGYGHHSAAALIALIYLCCGGVTVELPSDRRGRGA